MAITPEQLLLYVLGFLLALAYASMPIYVHLIYHELRAFRKAVEAASRGTPRAEDAPPAVSVDAPEKTLWRARVSDSHGRNTQTVAVLAPSEAFARKRLSEKGLTVLSVTPA